MLTYADVESRTGGALVGTDLLDVPGVQSAYDELLGRVQALSFVPATFAADVRESMKALGGTWQPRYAIRADAWQADKAEPLLPGIPSWLTGNPQAARAWNTLCDWWKERLQPILAGWARNEADVLAAANDDAEFFENLYQMVRPIAHVGEAILAIPEKAAETVSAVATGTIRGLLPVIGIVVLVAVAVLAYKNKMIGK